MNETRQCKPSLLEELRKDGGYSRHKMNLIIEHQSEFPSKLRPSIAAMAASSERGGNPFELLRQFYKDLKVFFQGRSCSHVTHILSEEWHGVDSETDTEEEIVLSEEWHGVDSEIDTEEEIELAIRLFPQVLEEEMKECTTLFPIRLFPICMLMSSAKAVSFVSLFLKLIAELIEKDSECFCFCFDSNGALTEYFLRTFLGNFSICAGSVEPRDQLDEASLVALTQMKQEVCVEEETIVSRVNTLLGNAWFQNLTYIEGRLRLMIEWNPRVLTRSEFNISRGFLPDSCLDGFLWLAAFNKEHTPSVETWNTHVRVFEVLTELGILHYPSKLGFVFHKSNYAYACHTFGKERVAQIVDEKLGISTTTRSNSNFNPTITSKDLLLAASTEKDISLDGVYTVLRRDPTVIPRL